MPALAPIARPRLPSNMDVVHMKTSQFRRVQPMVLYLPGFEPDNKTFYREEPELWKIYRRLSESQKPMRTLKAKQGCSFAPPTITIPAKDGMKCMCYENLLRIIRTQAPIPPPQHFRCSLGGNPTGRGSPHVLPSWPKKAMKEYRANEEKQLPLPTLVARWQFKRTLPSYDLPTLKFIFSAYGNVVNIRVLSPNSCLLIFEHLESACHVMQSRNIGDPKNKLHCSWWHKSMANKTVCTTAKGIKIRTDPFLYRF